MELDKLDHGAVFPNEDLFEKQKTHRHGESEVPKRSNKSFGIAFFCGGYPECVRDDLFPDGYRDM